MDRIGWKNGKWRNTKESDEMRNNRDKEKKETRVFRRETWFKENRDKKLKGVAEQIYTRKEIINEAAAKKSFKLAWRCHQLLSGFLATGHLSEVSHQSHRSLMIREIMKWFRGLWTYLLAFTLQLRKIPENSSRRQSDEGTVRPIIASNVVPYQQMKAVGSHCTSGSKGKAKRERTGELSISVPYAM